MELSSGSHRSRDAHHRPNGSAGLSSATREREVNMHTSRSMRTDEFEVTVAGTRGTFDDILPGLTTADRIAIVTHTPGGSLAAAPLLLAAVGRYYEILRRERDEFYR